MSFFYAITCQTEDSQEIGSIFLDDYPPISRNVANDYLRLTQMTTKIDINDRAEKLYLLLAALFIAALVVCNLIANKFITVDLGFKTFVISAGVLPYPITFLITDLLSELYGKKKTNRVVIGGLLTSAFVLVVLWLGAQFNAIPDSPVSDELYNTVFSNTWRVMSASMIAYICAQLIDVRIYHFWKKKTDGKHLWLRNNGSTIISQLVDTTLVVVVLFAGVLSWDTIGSFIFDGWLFKTICALIDTPIMYAATYLLTKYLEQPPNS